MLRSGCASARHRTGSPSVASWRRVYAQSGASTRRNAPWPRVRRGRSCLRPSTPRAIKKPDADSVSRSERVTRDIELDLERLEAAALSEEEEDGPSELEALEEAIDSAYCAFFAVGKLELDDGTTRVFDAVDEAEMQRLGRQEPQVCLLALLAPAQRAP